MFNPDQFDMDTVIMDYLWDEYREKQLKYMDQEENAQYRYYNISMIGYCLRRHYWTKTGQNVPNEATLRFGEFGNIIQDWSDDVLKKIYGDDIVQIERSITIPIKLPKQNTEYIYAVGRIDHLLSVRNRNNMRFYYPIEAKYKINKLVSKINDVEKKHKWQIQTYCLSMGSKKCLIYYIDHHFKAKTFHMDYDENLVYEGFDRLITLHDYVENQVIPPAEAMYDPDMKGDCWFCPFNKKCRELEQDAK